jgi:hypothetical protein
LSKVDTALSVVVVLSFGFLGCQSQAHAADRIHLRIIVVESRDKAIQVLGALERGEDFATLASQRSSDPSADDGGDLGAMRAEDLRAALRAAVQQLRPGQVSAVIKIPTGCLILQLPAEENSPSTVAIRRDPAINDHELDWNFVRHGAPALNRDESYTLTGKGTDQPRLVKWD